jgi:hypothetical protein
MADFNPPTNPFLNHLHPGWPRDDENQYLEIPPVMEAGFRKSPPESAPFLAFVCEKAGRQSYA